MLPENPGCVAGDHRSGEAVAGGLDDGPVHPRDVDIDACGPELYGGFGVVGEAARVRSRSRGDRKHRRIQGRITG